MAEKKKTTPRTSKKAVKRVPVKRTAKPVHHREPAPEKPVSAEPVVTHPARQSYVYAVGRRKTSIARIRFYASQTGPLQVNGQDLGAYFVSEKYQKIINEPLVALGELVKGRIFVKVIGGGYNSQAESIRMGIARVMVNIDPLFKPPLKKLGYLTRDSRIKERKKYGLRRARRAPQWQKR